MFTLSVVLPGTTQTYQITPETSTYWRPELCTKPANMSSTNHMPTEIERVTAYLPYNLIDNGIEVVKAGHLTSVNYVFADHAEVLRKLEHQQLCTSQ